MNLITVSNALELILSQSMDFGNETIHFQHSEGRILKEAIIADRDFPPFHRVSMDGIAFHTDAFSSLNKTFRIEGIQAAGSPKLVLKDTRNCMEAMTGAVLPENTNAVIQYEKVNIKNGIAELQVDEVKHFQNVHEKGMDRKKGDIIIPENRTITSAEIGVLATVGKHRVKVAKTPRVMVISTGNELVAVNEDPLEHQIRRSNVHTLVSLLKELHIPADSDHLPDNKETLKKTIALYLNEYDVLMFSGAVSKGKFDFIPEVLDDLGVKKLFHKVKQRPGKPFWFGIKEHAEAVLTNTAVFAFPGNPVSTYVNCLKYFYPWYKRSAGCSDLKTPYAQLACDFEFKPGLSYFLQVKLSIKNGELIAEPIAGKGSGDLANLVDADGFLELPSDESIFTKGSSYPVYIFRKSAVTG